MDQESTSRCYFSVGSGVVSWRSTKQKFVALSSIEVEYMGANMGMCEAILLQKILVSLFSQKIEITNLNCDNQSCIRLYENLMFHDRSKHIDMWYHFIIDRVQCGEIPIDQQGANTLTKDLGRDKFVYCREHMGIVENTFLTKMEC